jgi:RNA polymerase sigma-70 factor, ECF subfamily
MTERLHEIAFQEPALEREEDGTTWHDRFDALVERQSSFVFRVAYSVLRNHHDADDVVQETFLKLYRTRKWEGIDNERAFLARVAWRIAVDRRPKVQVDVGGSGLRSEDESPEQAVIAADWNATVHRLIDALPDELRQPLALSTVEELKSHEIAAVMGIPDGTVRSRLSRARQILKQKLEALMEGPHA